MDPDQPASLEMADQDHCTLFVMQFILLHNLVDSEWLVFIEIASNSNSYLLNFWINYCI